MYNNVVKVYLLNRANGINGYYKNTSTCTAVGVSIRINGLLTGCFTDCAASLTVLLH